MILRLLLLSQHSLLEVVLLSLHNDLSFVPSLVLLSQLLLHISVTPAIMMFALSCKFSVAAYGGNLLGCCNYGLNIVLLCFNSRCIVLLSVLQHS